MKIGDSKQAITLGTVAVIAVGFLAKTALGSFGGMTASRPLEVKELRGGPAPAANPNANAAPKDGDQPNPTKTAVVDPAKPAPGSDGSLLLVKDAFAKFPVQSRDGSKGITNQGEIPQNIPRESMTPTQKEGPSIPPVFPLTGQIEGGPITSDGKEIGKNDRKSEQVPEPVVKKDPVTMRFDGYVNAGKPMAVLTYKGVSYTLSVGDLIADGWKVVTISNDKVTVSREKVSKTILVGREIEF